jgi:hypothetical protein
MAYTMTSTMTFTMTSTVIFTMTSTIEGSDLQNKIWILAKLIGTGSGSLLSLILSSSEAINQIVSTF